MTLGRAARALPALLLSLWLGGCALLQPNGVPASAAASTAAASAPAGAASAAARGSEPGAGSGTPGLTINVSAPGELKALLERHLDLVRLGSAAGNDLDDSEWSRLINATPAQARELLQTEGYFAPKVSVQRVPGRSDGAPDTVLVAVEPGLRARIGRVTIEAEGEMERGASSGDAYATAALAQLRDRWALPGGSEFRNASWADAKATAMARLRAAGYALAVWSGTTAEVDVETQTVRLFLVADSGPLFRLGDFNVEGLVAQDPQTVRNLAATRAGVPVTEALLLDFQDRLQKAGLFESVSVLLDTDPARAATAQVLVRLREAPLQVWTFGVGVSANTGARASVEHLYRRVLGFAATAHNKFEWGDKRQAWEGDITAHPGEGLYRNLVGGAVENLKTDTDTVLSQRLRVGRTQDTQRLERLFFAEIERSRRTPDNGDPSSAYALSGNFHGGWRDLDSILLPTQGATLAIQLGVGRSHGTDAKTGLFQRAYGRLTGYLPLGQAWYGQARIELGQVFLPSGVVVPDSKLFRAGGDDSVRGYSFRSLGPLVDGAVGGGKSLMTASVELARPISAALPSVWGAVFVDAGNAANSFGALKPAYGVGVGVRWRSPVGPLRVDWAWGDQTRKFRLHFSVGIAF
jgi:translocation and assembly module TamA